MTTRFYIMPMVTTVVNSTTYQEAKYLKGRHNSATLTARYTLMPYGRVPACLVAADVTPEQHAELAAYDDVAAVPLNLDSNITDAALPRVKAVLEALRLPAEWVTAAFTYRQALRIAAQMIQLGQRYSGMWKETLIDAMEHLDLTWNQIPAQRRIRIRAAADSFGWDYSAVQNSWTIRRILRHLADQWGSGNPIYLGGETF